MATRRRHALSTSIAVALLTGSLMGEDQAHAANVNFAAVGQWRGSTVRGDQRGATLGHRVAGAGDTNGDGFDDVLICAYRHDAIDRVDAGRCTVVFGTRDPLPDVSFVMDLVASGRGFAVDGVAAEDLAGTTADGVGDINGDGLDDIVMGSYFAGTEDRRRAGAAYVVFGGALGVVDLADLSNNAGSGVALLGAAASNASGFAVRGAGDLNGDGLGDLLVAAPLADPFERNTAGEVVVVFGRQGAWPATLELASAVSPQPGLATVITGADVGSGIGFDVGSADVNGDGRPEIIIGAPFQGIDGERTGAVLIVSSVGGAWPAIVDLANPSASGFAMATVYGELPLTEFGSPSRSAGDVDGDGRDDLLIAAHRAPGFAGEEAVGRTYLVPGREIAALLNGAPATMTELLGRGARAFVGEFENDFSGFAVAGKGDYNGDGMDDLLIGAYRADPNGGASGRSYLLFGNANFQSMVTPSAAVTSLDAIAFDGVNGTDDSGRSLDFVGDFNGDGSDDLIVGAWAAGKAGASFGEAYIVLSEPAPRQVPSFGSRVSLALLTLLMMIATVWRRRER